MRFIPATVVFICLLMSLQACSIITPYSSKFSCPDQEAGKCQSIKKNYLESLRTIRVEEEVSEGEPECGEECYGYEEGGQSKDRIVRATYEEMVLKRFEDLVAQQKAPMVMPAQAMRILVLPYKGKDGHLFMERYIYFFTEEPKWLMEGVP